MGIDYYKVLKLSEGFTPDDLKRSYYKLSMRWHPDKNPLDRKKAESRFKEISEAYEVLSDPHKRAIYNKHGEEGLKGPCPKPGSGTQGFSNGGDTGMFRFHPQNAEEVFVRFFGGTSPFAGLGGDLNIRNHKCTDDDDLLAISAPKSPQKCMSCVPQPKIKEAAKKATPVRTKFPCTLEELFNGCIRKMKISRIVLNKDGNPIPAEEVLTIEVKPGWKKGTKITFPEKGNHQPNMIPADLVFIVDERPHDTFKRDGDDLVAVQKITVCEALVGYTAVLTTCDKRILSIPCLDIIYPGYEKVVHREGMPFARDPSKKGNLRLRFQLIFPTRLTMEQKEGIQKSLPDSLFPMAKHS